MKVLLSKTFLLLSFSIYLSKTQPQTTAKEYFDKGILLFDKQKYSEATIVFDIASNTNPTYAAAFYYAGWYYSDLNNFEKAIFYKSDYYLPYQELEYAYKQAKKYDDAVVQFKKAIAKKDDYAVAKKQLAMYIKVKKKLTKQLMHMKNATIMISKI